MEDFSTYPLAARDFAGDAKGRDQVIGLALGHVELEGRTCIQLGELEGVHGLRALGLR